MKIALKNFLTTLRRYRTASLLNIAGLAIAFAAFYAIMSQVWWEWTFNRSIPHSERTYVAAADDLFDKGRYMPYIARPSMEQALEESPEVEAAGAVDWWGSGFGENYVWVRRNGALAPERFTLDEDTAFSASDGLLDVLPFRAVAGDLRALGRPGTVIIARSMAERLGVDIGALLYVQQAEPETPLELAAIYEDLPDNSLGRNLKILRFIGDMNMYDFGMWNTHYYLRLGKGADPDRFVARWTEIDREVRQVGRQNDRGYVSAEMELRLVPVRETYFHPAMTLPSGHGQRSVTLTLVGIAVLVILIALINFVNFFFALLPARLRTVNVFKVFGAPTRALRFNFLFEAVGFVLVALLAAWYILFGVMQTGLRAYFPESLSLADNAAVAAIVAAAAVIAILAASLWPARYITSFSPVLAAKGYAGSKAGRRLRTGLIAVQSFITQSLIIVALVMWGQHAFMSHADPGFRTERLLVTELPVRIAENSALRNALLSRLTALPQIERYAFASRKLPITSGNWNWGPTIDGRQANFAMINCDTTFAELLGIEPTEGRLFTQDDWQKGSAALIVNECARRRYGVQTGDRIHQTPVLGICPDFHYASMQYAIEPLVLNLANTPDYWLRILYLRLAPGADVAEVSRAVCEAVHKVLPTTEASEIEPRLFSSLQREACEHESRTATIITTFSLLAVAISLMGIFGLVLFETQYRRREIAVRKVMGATTEEVLAMFNRRYVAITLGCFVAACPVAAWFAERWLAEFAYRMSGIAWMFVAAFVLVTVVTAATVTLRSWRAASENPADSMKSE